MKLLDICKIANMGCPAHLSECEVAGISSDSREIGENFVFVCLEGTRTDGHGFIDEALKKGACAAVIQNEKYECDRSITVESTRRALSNMLDAFYGQPSKKLKFIGITGTNGKTSVSVMIKNILDTQHIPCELIGTLNCSSFSESFNGSQTNFTTPDPEQLYKMLF